MADDSGHDHAPATIAQITEVLSRAGRGQAGAADQLLPLVYDQLRALARRQLGQVRPGQTLQPTALVHEAWMRVVGSTDPGWNSQAHFYKAAAQAMRNVLVDAARRKSAQKRGGDRDRVDGGELDAVAAPAGVDVVALDDAIRQLEQREPAQAEIVSLRFFAGSSMEEVAQILGTSLSTVERHWRAARDWLREQLRHGETDGG